MDAVITAARELGRLLQADGRYTRYIEAKKLNDEDTALQEMIGNFNMTRTRLNSEIGKEDKDQERIKELDAELKTQYRDIFANGNMLEFTDARNDMEALIGFVNQIITGASNGLDPESIEYEASCGGSCSSCKGCA